LTRGGRINRFHVLDGVWRQPTSRNRCLSPIQQSGLRRRKKVGHGDELNHDWQTTA